jgi:hypothetical protein
LLRTSAEHHLAQHTQLSRDGCKESPIASVPSPSTFRASMSIRRDFPVKRSNSSSGTCLCFADGVPFVVPRIRVFRVDALSGMNRPLSTQANNHLP